MSERWLWLLKGGCVALAAVVLIELAGLVASRVPLADLPEWPEDDRAAASSDTTGAPPAPAMHQPPASGPAVALPPGMARPASPLPPELQKRVDRIVQSEILGPVPRPLPMALLGIAGPDALIRTAGGQTGWLREGETLGDVKLLRIGTNRVLIEHEGQQKELSLWSGLGGSPLLEQPSQPSVTNQTP